MNKVQLPQCGLFRKSAVLLAIFLAIVFNVPAQVPSPAPAAAGARDAQGNLLPGASATAERVIVTGSNIPTAEEVGPNPVDIYNQETMSKSGERTTEQFLQSIPTVNANIVPQSNNENGTNTAVGAATIALRGFDARATLILIDGRRVAPYPTGNNPGLVNVMFVDLNSIPAAAIDSIEILKDGASTTYGADAVAGVVNIKLTPSRGWSISSCVTIIKTALKRASNTATQSTKIRVSSSLRQSSASATTPQTSPVF